MTTISHSPQRTDNHQPALDAPAEPRVHCPLCEEAPLPDLPAFSADESVLSTERRNLFWRAGGALLALGAGAVAVPRSVRAAPSQQEPPPPAMRSPRNGSVTAAATAAVVPPSEVMALTRMGFGLRPLSLSEYAALGSDANGRFTAFVEQQLNPAAIVDTECDNRLAAQGFKTLGKTLGQLWSEHTHNDEIEWYERILPILETQDATFIRAVYSKRQLAEVMADFWHNHFNIYGWDFWGATTWVQYDRDVIRANLFGNFRTMLEAMAKSVAMLYYLDNISNSSAGPNENFARELFELHGMGAENYQGVVKASTIAKIPAGQPGAGLPIGYCDSDVYETTRCLTGWRLNKDTGAFAFEEPEHDRYRKSILGVEIAEFGGVTDGDVVFDLIANHPRTGRYIARKLARRLIGDTPPERVVEEAATVFYNERNAPDQLKKVVRSILMAPEFRAVWGEKIKRPYEFAVGILRSSNVNWTPNDNFYWSYSGMGQQLFGWRPPNGYPDLKEDWSSTMPMLQRWRFINWLLEQRVGGEGPDKDNYRMDFNAQTPPAIKSPYELVDFWARRILGYYLPAEEREPIALLLASGRNPDYDLPDDQLKERLRFGVALIYMSPSFQLR